MYKLAKRLLKSESGAIAINFALVSVALVGAAGLGLDTYRLQNAATALDHTVKLTCDRFSNADLALYPTAEERIQMGTEFAAKEIERTSLDVKRTKLTLVPEKDQVKIKGKTEVDATFMQLLGYGKLERESEMPCAMPSTEPTDKACTPDDLVYMNPGTFETAAGTLIAGTKNYTATLYDQTGKILKRQIIGNGTGETEVFLKSRRFTDMVVVQPFHGDGTVPSPCNPTIKPPEPAVCTPDRAFELGKAFYQRVARYDAQDWKRSTILPRFMKSGSIEYTYSPSVRQYLDPHLLVSYDRLNPRPVSVSTSAGFEPDYMYPMWSDSTRDPTIDFLHSLATDMSWYNARLLFGRSKLYRIISSSGAVWEINGQCVFVTSPIVLDLPNLGRIATTGKSGAYYPVPRHPVQATVKFAMGSNATLFDTEWITGNGQALLVDNRDGKAATDMNGSRLFGNSAFDADGYAKLARLDADGDSVVAGPELAGLMAWIDNGDAIVQPGELKSVQELGITQLSTVVERVPTGDGGVHLRSTALVNGKQIMTEDVWFGIDLTAPSGQHADAGQ